jgi:peptide-methionine (S)-S-oxide reductase
MRAAAAVFLLALAGFAPAPAGRAEAVFAMGCFWCGESDLEKLPGVIEVISGYTGGRTANPTYREVGSDMTGHVEAVRVVFDPARISYGQLLDAFWSNIDPDDDAGQFCDKGSSYRAAIFPKGPAQQAAAAASKAAVEKRLGRKVATTIRPAATFWPAETYHQDYYKKNPLRYRLYRSGCGRDARLKAVWGK